MPTAGLVRWKSDERHDYEQTDDCIPRLKVNRDSNMNTEQTVNMKKKQTVMKTKQTLTQPQRVSLQLPLLILLTVALLGGALTASAATKTWVPTAGGSWATAGNWSPGGAPAAGDDVVISSDQSASITAVPTISLNSLTVNGNCPLAGATSGNRITIY